MQQDAILEASAADHTDTGLTHYVRDWLETIIYFNTPLTNTYISNTVYFGTIKLGTFCLWTGLSHSKDTRK